jgi:molecular chaperone HtpG
VQAVSDIVVPKLLLDLLQGSPLGGRTASFVDAVATLAADNKVPFFPDYTDHGPHHIQRVLEDCVRLIPSEVWSRNLLTPTDASVLICAVALHDIGMHLRPRGFLELVHGETDHGPLQWFNLERAGRPADVPWPEAWQAFRTEVRHLTRSQLDRILGPRNSGVPAVAQGDGDRDADAWTAPDHLVIGEFLRRHHARLAHEIAMYGFPGAGEAFPVLAELLSDVADAVGVVARSHNESLRGMVDYCGFQFKGDKTPWGTFAPYLMGLLRVADYLQLDVQRAPVILLNLRDPASRTSVEEWKKHLAVQRISWITDDPAAIYVGVSHGHELHTHLQLRTLLDGLQREMDTTTGLLSEIYAAPELRVLELSRRRVRTNLDDPSLHERLPYIPRGAALRSDDDLFRLFMSDLYGDHPAVAGRELLQNAVDAVRERRRLSGLGPDDALAGDGRPDVEILLEELEEGMSRLTVTDRGIGMTAETVESYFLTAGASFGPTPSDFEGLSSEEAAGWMKAGRFGVGVFAAFLLASDVEVTTRHMDAQAGLRFTASLNQDLVRLDKVECPVGTTVTMLVRSEMLIASSSLQGRQVRSVADFLEAVAGFFRLDRPTIGCRAVELSGSAVDVRVPADVPASEWDDLPDTWRTVPVPGFDQVLIEVVPQIEGRVVHNGMRIGMPSRFAPTVRTEWSHEALTAIVRSPSVALFDSRHLLGLSLTRFALKDPHLPGEAAILGILGTELVAAALASSDGEFPFLRADSGTAVVTGSQVLPLLPSVLAASGMESLCALWTVDGEGVQSARSCEDPDSRWFMDWSESGPFPARMCLTTSVAWTDDGIPLWDPNTIIGSSEKWSAWFGRPVLGSVVVDPDLPAFHRLNPVWQTVQDAASDEGHPTIIGTGEPEIVAPLVELASEMYEPREGSVALTVFGPPEAMERPDDALAAAWVEQLGGQGIDRRPRHLQAQRRQLAASSPEWRDAIERWTRIWDRYPPS